jgi:hypothetical protein
LKDILPLLLELARLYDSEDLVEYCLQALEGFTLKCPLEITLSLGEITRLAVESLQYDPNYNDEESSEGGMDVDGSDDEKAEDEEEEYELFETYTLEMQYT